MLWLGAVFANKKGITRALVKEGVKGIWMALKQDKEALRLKVFKQVKDQIRLTVKYERGGNGRSQRMRSGAVGWSFDDGSSGNFHHQESQKQDVRSFVEVVAGLKKRGKEIECEEKDKMASLSWVGGKGDVDWLERSVVGVMKSFSNRLGLNLNFSDDVSPLVSIEDDQMVGVCNKCVQIKIKDKKESKGVRELCISDNDLGGWYSRRKAVFLDKGPIMSLECAISNFNLVRGRNGMRKVSGGSNFSGLEDVGLEGCGVVKSVGLIRGLKEGPSVSTSENKLVSDPVPHDDSEFAAEDDGLFSEAGEDLREAGHDFPGHDSSNKSIKRHGKIMNHSKDLALDLNQDFRKEIIVPGMKKASWNTKEELAKVIKAEIVRRIKAGSFRKLEGILLKKNLLAFVSLWLGWCLCLRGYFLWFFGP
ncbi:hypothetical protein LWI29_017078 [Acer saccharum]|uniref:Uncharacterized protein n=1 Tax=Acer saccharum TaxID=4024 RepID=A0AA39T4H0_ACESA|nr:hypothetical protein LWI29_017078 [Acer saccharum]